MNLRDRVVGLRRVPAASLVPNPKNWRLHPRRQQDALRAALAEIGIADVLLVRELTDGRLMLLDGHLRAEVLGGSDVPVLVLDVDEAEADKLLATLDPLTGLAEIDTDRLADLLAGIDFAAPALERLAADLLAGDAPAGAADEDPSDPDETPLPEGSFQVCATCDDESAQRALYERLTAEGYRCRVLTL